MSNKGSYDMKKQYGRNECAFSVTMPDHRGRPTPEHHCSQNSQHVTHIHNVIGVKSRSLDPRMDREACARSTPLNTTQPGQGWCPFNQQYVPPSSAASTTTKGGPVHNEGPVAFGRQNRNQGNTYQRMGGDGNHLLRCPKDPLQSTTQSLTVTHHRQSHCSSPQQTPLASAPQSPKLAVQQ